MKIQQIFIALGAVRRLAVSGNVYGDYHKMAPLKDHCVILIAREPLEKSNVIVDVTQHARKRFKERVGLPKRAAKAAAQRAFDQGICRFETTGRLRRFMDASYRKEDRAANNLRIYGMHVYVFANTTLITVLHVPEKFRHVVTAKMKAKEKQDG